MSGDNDNDDDKIPQVIIPPEMQAEIDKDPKLAEAMRDMSAQMRQAMQGVQDGKYADFNDAMEALTGQRPKLFEPRYVPKYGLYLAYGPHPNQADKILAVCTDGSPHQAEHEEVVVLTIETVDTVEQAKAWFQRVMIEEPWMDDEEEDDDDDEGGNDTESDSSH